MATRTAARTASQTPKAKTAPQQAKPKPAAKPAPSKASAPVKEEPAPAPSPASSSPSTSPAVSKAKAVAKAKKDPANKKPKRIFKVILSEVDPKVDPEQFTAGGGKYMGVTPLQAARKAFRTIAAKYSKTDDCEFKFAIQETTEMSKKSTFRYVGKRTVRDEPQTVSKTNKAFDVKYKIDVKSWKGGPIQPVKKRRGKKAAAAEPIASAEPVVEQNGHTDTVGEEPEQIEQGVDEAQEVLDEPVAEQDEELSEDEELQE